MIIVFFVSIVTDVAIVRNARVAFLVLDALKQKITRMHAECESRIWGI